MALQDNTLNKQQTQKRILIATLLSFAFFVGYDFLYLQPKQAAVNLANEQNKKIVEQQAQHASTTQNTAPSTISNSTAAPTAVNEQKSEKLSPLANKNKNITIVSTITTNKSIYEIDAYGRISQVTLRESKYKDENGDAIKLFTATQLKPLEVRFADTDTNNEAFKTAVSTTNAKLDATKQNATLTLTQKRWQNINNG